MAASARRRSCPAGRPARQWTLCCCLLLLLLLLLLLRAIVQLGCSRHTAAAAAARHVANLTTANRLCLHAISYTF